MTTAVDKKPVALVPRGRRAANPDTPKAAPPDDTACLFTADGHPIYCTDRGNSYRFVQLFHGTAMHVASLRTWYIYDGKRWCPDRTNRVMQLTKQVIISMQTEAARSADLERKHELSHWAKCSEALPRLTAIVTLAATELGVDAEKLDADLNLLNFQNGTFDLRTCTLRPHDPGDRLTKILPADYDPDARSALWESVLLRALPDPDVRRYVQKLAGYTLSGQRTEDILVLAHGVTRSAKGTILGAIEAAMGEYAATGSIDLLVKRKAGRKPEPELLGLRKARMVAIHELGDDHAFDTALVKTLTGGDLATFRGVFALNPETYRPSFTIWISTNHRPRVPADDAASFERFREVPFTVQIPDGERDPTVRHQLRDPRISGAAILAWMVEGYQLWLDEGLTPPVAVRAATEAFRTAMQPLKHFLNDCCTLDRSAWTLSETLRNAYLAWNQDYGDEPLSVNSFSE